MHKKSFHSTNSSSSSSSSSPSSSHNHHQSNEASYSSNKTANSKASFYQNNQSSSNNNNNNKKRVGEHFHSSSPKKQHFHNSNNNNNNQNHHHHHSNNNNKINNMKQSKLAVFQYKEAFLKLLCDNQTIIVVGETGSGKTTQIPPWCLDYSYKRTKHQLCVACTQPRRIAAMSVSARVANEMNVTLGEEVGYSVRFDNCSSQNKTKLKYLTDGMLLREAMLDSNLSSYGVIILDEAHERTLQTEILLGVIKQASLARNDQTLGLPPLKIIIMSATINIDLFKNYFNNCPSLKIEGRQHPVQDFFAENHQSDLLTSTLITVFQIHRTSNEGDILVFCSGQDEITSLITLCKRVLKQAPENLQNLLPLPLYASLPTKNQMRVFDLSASLPTNNKQTNGFSHNNNNTSNNNKSNKKNNDNDSSNNYNASTSNGLTPPSSPTSTNHSYIRRVIFATNVAETSVTIPNIKFVIDTGKVKCRTYCPKTGLESLKITDISKAQAIQRSGRAGRISAGSCYRLYTSEEHEKMKDHLLPEIKRSNLDGVILQMISIGIKNIASFDFFERPDDARIKSALSNLLTLKAIKLSSISGNGSHSSSSSSSNTNNKLSRNPILAIESEKSKKISSQLSLATTKQESTSSPSTPLSSISSPTPSTSKSTHGNSAKKQRILDGDHILNLNYELTSLGKKLTAFPLSPNMSRVLLAANELNCLEEALTIVSLLYIENLFHIPPNKQNQADQALAKFRSNEGDTIMLLKVYKAFRRVALVCKANQKPWCNEHFINVKNLKLAQSVRKQLSDLCKSMGMKMSSCGHDTSVVRRALTYGLFNNVASMWNGKYRNKYSNDIHIHPNSCLFRSNPETILYVEIVETNKCYLRNCTLIDINWVREISSTNTSEAGSLN